MQSPRPHLEVTKPASDPTCSTKPALLACILPFACRGQRLPSMMLDALFWDVIFSTDVASPEGLSNIATLLCSPPKVADARSLHGDQAQRFIDLLDQVSDSSKRTLVPRVMTTRPSFLHCHTSMRDCLGGLQGCFTRSAKPRECCPPRTSSNRSTSMSASSGGKVGLQTWVKENVTDALWLSNS